MFAGHVGAALAIGRAQRRVNVGVFVLAALLLDLVLWVLVLLGWESVAMPADFASTHQPQFVFPFSHSLLAGVAWSVLAALLAWVCYPRLAHDRVWAALLLAAAVFSHWLLDALVHAPELPLAGNTSMKVGLGLWNAMPVALAIEAVIALAGLALFIAGAGLSRARKIALALLSLVILTGTVAGMTVAAAPPSIAAMAWSSLGTIALVCLLAAWIGRRA
jgi:membrane-bound metal-dependent hydrolase YbcI (DUF457 family)